MAKTDGTAVPKIDTDRPYRDGAAAILRQLPDVVSAEDHEGAARADGAHDIEVALSTGESVAVEVTRLVDGPTLGTFNELRKADGVFEIPDSGTWQVLLGEASVRVKQLVRELVAVVRELESLGVSRADPLTWATEPADVSIEWRQRRAIFERMEPFGVLDLSRVEEAGGVLEVQGPVYGGFASPGELAAGIEARVAAKAGEVRGRGDEAWVFVWVDWTNLLPDRVLRPDADIALPDVALPNGIDRVVASVIAFEAGPRLPIAQWRTVASAARAWVDRKPVDAAFREASRRP